MTQHQSTSMAQMVGRGAPWAAAILVALSIPLSAASAETSAWAKGSQSRARLIGGGRAPAAPELLAGVEIELEPRFITYWRDPGDAGVPPSFSFAGSSNLKSAVVRYPAPRRLDEAGAKAFGYENGVIFPVLVEAIDPSKPVDLALTLDYAVCHEICLPARADLRLALDGRSAADDGRLREALAAVPRSATVGAAGGAVSILAVKRDGTGGFSVTASAEAAAGQGTLFVEAPEGWAYEAGDAIPTGDGRAMFPVKRLDQPRDAGHPPAVVLTLVTPVGAIEVPAQLDAASTKP